MFSFSKARQNMVDCQIHPSGVINPALLNAFETIPREAFVPEFNKPLAYHDEDLVFRDGRFMLEPSTHARMVQALDLKPSDIVLDIGCAGGYSSAVLSPFVTTIIALEQTQKYLDDAQLVWDEHGFCNIASFKGALNKGCPDHAPYHAIIINGSVAKHPVHIANQLAVGGKMIYILKETPQDMGHVTVAMKSQNGDISSVPLFDAATPYLNGFEPKQDFVF